MTEITSLSGEHIYKLWEKGFPKSVAYYSFVATKYRTRYLRLKRLMEGYSSRAISDMIASLSAPDSSFKTIQTTTSPHQKAFEELDKALKSLTWAGLESRTIIPLGFEVPRLAKHTPIIVPDDVWRRGMNWNNNTFKTGSLEIEDVRFIHKSWIDKYLESIASKDHSGQPVLETERSAARKVLVSNKPGRPSTKEAIQAAFQKCHELGYIDYSRPKKEAVDTVRSYITKHHPEKFGIGKGFEEKTILKHISEKFDSNSLK